MRVAITTKAVAGRRTGRVETYMGGQRASYATFDAPAPHWQAAEIEAARQGTQWCDYVGATAEGYEFEAIFA